jgi:hypothetical protein
MNDFCSKIGAGAFQWMQLSFDQLVVFYVVVVDLVVVLQPGVIKKGFLLLLTFTGNSKNNFKSSRTVSWKVLERWKTGT